MNLKFTYVNAAGEAKKRNILVVHESTDQYAGFDLKNFSRKEAASLRKVFGKRPVTPFPAQPTSVDYSALAPLGITKEMFVRGYRTFNKDKIR